MANVNERFIIKLQGKEFVTYEGLLSMAHDNGLLGIEVEILQFPTSENNMTCICKATAKTKDMVFTDIGDANPVSVNSALKPHIIRMASTRAKARALRDLNNIGMTAIEEMMDDTPDVKVGNGNGKQGTYQKPNNKVNTERITLDQANELKELIKLKNIKIDVILNHNKVPTIEAMTQSQYEGARNFLMGR